MGQHAPRIPAKFAQLADRPKLPISGYFADPSERQLSEVFAEAT